MFFNPQKEDAKEVASGIINTFRVGLLKAKYRPVAGEFELPKTIFKDIYVLGFIVGFTTSCLYGLLKGKKWTSNQSKVEDFIFEVYKALGMSKDEQEVCIRLTGDEDYKKKSDKSGDFDKGASDARTMFGATYGLLRDDDPDPVLKQAREVAEKSPNVLGAETPETKLHFAIGQLTIWKHLKQTYGEEVSFKKNEQQREDGVVEVDKKTERAPSEKNQKEERKKWETRVFRNLKLLFDIDIGQIRADIRPTRTKDYDELDRLLSGLWIDDISSLVSTLTVVDNLHEGGLLLKPMKHFDYDDMIKHYKKCKTIIELNQLDDGQIPFVYFGEVAFLPHIDNVIERLQEDIEYDENDKTDSEKLISEIFCSHRRLMRCAKNCLSDEKKTSSNPFRWTEAMFLHSRKLDDYLKKLGRLKGIDYPDAVMEVLLCENSFPKVIQQKIYNEIKACGAKGLDDNDVVKRLVLKDFGKLK